MSTRAMIFWFGMVLGPLALIGGQKCSEVFPRMMENYHRSLLEKRSEYIKRCEGEGGTLAECEDRYKRGM